MSTLSFRELLKNRLNREDIYSKPDYWNWKAAEYDGNAISMWPNNHLNYYYHREQLSVLRKYLPNGRATVLDVGCGTGRISRYLAEQGSTVLGIDFSEKAIEIARRQSPPQNPRYEVQSIFDLDFENSFDFVVSLGILIVACRNRLELTSALARLWRSLKPDGALLLIEPIHKGFLHRVLDMNMQEFRAVMAEVGFDIQSVTNLHFWPMRLVLAHLPWPKALTAAGYHIGQSLMALLGNKFLGDYKAVYASARGK